ncbi:hypothetical protein IQ219_00715 [Synechocystis sp. LEGE 06083]|uniref:hypothetical protein n=1 Tax=Synechocystis sp. LEGE 06083 TaxID=915336 RepID=UPI0018811FD2|nr:hypothetical protein [Synechocystis sp. LEGE 06083]MBE9193879.1 hypothetical protein [Synechocystis sp. LEGE 06083]
MTIEFDPINFEVKPALFVLDNWQTHDLLSMHHTNFYSPRFIVNGWNVIDRYVPHDLPWCNGWAEKAYAFAEEISVERHVNFGNVSAPAGVLLHTAFGENLEALTVAPPIVSNPQPFPLEEPEEIELIIEPNKTLYLTWLTISKETSIPVDAPNDKLPGKTGVNSQASLRIFERRSFSVSNPTDEEKEYIFTVPIDMANFSLVITNGKLKEEESNDFLYSAMSSRLAAWVESFDINLTTIVGARFGMLVPIPRQGADGRLLEVKFAQRNSAFHYAGLLFANNNPWGQVLELEDLGFPPLLKPEYGSIAEKPMPKQVDVNRNKPIAYTTANIANPIPLPKYPDASYPPSKSLALHPGTGYALFLGPMDLHSITYTPLDSYDSQQDTVSFDEIVEFLESELESESSYLEEIMMTDSPRIKEIHAALEADRYGVHPSDPEKKRFNNLGRYLETLAYATGIAFNEDGKNIPQPESNWVDADYIATINANQSLRNGQFAVREVNDAYGQRMVCDALFEVRARQVTTTTDEQGNLQVASTSPGGAMRVPHIGGIFDTIQDDLTKYWGGGDLMVPKIDGTGIVYYDSIGECLADCLYMLGSHSKSINELQNQSIKSVFLLQEILRALGLPCHVAAVKGVSPSALGEEGGVMPCPELDEKSPTLASLIGLVLINLSRVVGASIAFREDNSAPSPEPGAEPDPDVGGASA